jgi:hypothetical protein
MWTGGWRGSEEEGGRAGREEAKRERRGAWREAEGEGGREGGREKGRGDMEETNRG